MSSTPWGSYPSSILTWTKAGRELQSASCEIDSCEDICSLFLRLLAAAQALDVDFLPLTWHPELDVIGEGATAEVRQRRVNRQKSFAFKRPKPHSRDRNIDILLALVSEVTILGNPSIKHHSNVLGIEGLCWDVTGENETVWPVLVFEKADMGDLKTFISSANGGFLNFQERLNICLEVGLAVRDMHALSKNCLFQFIKWKGLIYPADIVHGDLKPDNILMFSDVASGFTAKVADFGYSTLLAQDSQTIYMPESGHWTAPEWHHRGIGIESARRMDAYSFAMICFWLLIYTLELKNDQDFRNDIASSINLLNYTSDMTKKALCVAEEQKPKFLHFFNLTLQNNPDSRVSDFNILLQILRQN